MDLKNNFVVIEGPDGSGKSTISKHISLLISASGRDVVRTREPGQTPIGAKLREIMLMGDELTPEALVMMMNTDRVLNMQKNVIPALADGKVVISDRSWLSTMVYQSYETVWDRDTVEAICRAAMFGVEPNLITILVPAQQSWDRVIARGEKLDNFESKGLAQFEKLVDRYKEMTEMMGGTVIWNTGTIEDSITEAMRHISAA